MAAEIGMSSRKRARRAVPDADEAALAGAVFGGGALLASLTAPEDGTIGAAASTPAPAAEGALYAIDRGGAAAGADVGTPADGAPEDSAAAAWEDEEEAALRVNIAAAPRARKLRRARTDGVVTGSEYAARLKAQFEASSGDTSWAAVASGGRPEEGSALQAALRSTAPATAAAAALGSGSISVTRRPDGNIAEAAKAVVTAVAWHPAPASQLLLVGSKDKRLRLFAADGEGNGKVASAFTEDMPVTAAGFVQGGAEVIAVGRRPFFYAYDVGSGALARIAGLTGRKERSWESVALSPATGASAVHAFFGNGGAIALVSATSKAWVGGLKMEGQVRAGAFSGDGRTLVTAGTEGRVYHWDLRRPGTALAVHDDDGLSPGSAVGVDPTGGTFAVGSTSGVVNLYGALPAGGAVPQQAFAPLTAAGGGSSGGPPLRKRVMNLTTPIDCLAYNGDGQLLALASRRAKDQMRLLHVPSGTVYANWPTSGTPLHYVSAAAFSPDSSFLAVGNDRGRVLLYSLNHYAAARG